MYNIYNSICVPNFDNTVIHGFAKPSEGFFYALLCGSFSLLPMSHLHYTHKPSMSYIISIMIHILPCTVYTYTQKTAHHFESIFWIDSNWAKWHHSKFIRTNSIRYIFFCLLFFTLECDLVGSVQNKNIVMAFVFHRIPHFRRRHFIVQQRLVLFFFSFYFPLLHSCICESWAIGLYETRIAISIMYICYCRGILLPIHFYCHIFFHFYSKYS